MKGKKPGTLTEDVKAALGMTDDGENARAYAVFHGTSNGSRQFLRITRSKRHMAPLYGKSYGLFTQGLKLETR
jgi:hypothetical protein